MSNFFTHGYAVVVGVGADLSVTIDDANAVADLLLDPKRCSYPENQVRLLTGEHAQRVNIISALNWLAASTGEHDTAVVYFSGHGIEMPDYYLVPYGFNWDDLALTAISGSEFTEHLRAIKAGKLVVLLDCCHAGGLGEAKSYLKSPLPYDALNELSRSSGRVIIASSRRNEVSLIGTPYSQFTMAVIEALAGYGAFEQDGFARVLDLSLHVGRVVPDRTNDQQHPVIKISNLKDNFAISWYAGGDSMVKSLPWKSETNILRPAKDDSQAITWRRMLANYRDSLLLIDERMSEYIIFTDIPLQLLKNKQQTVAKIEDLERLLQERQT